MTMLALRNVRRFSSIAILYHVTCDIINGFIIGKDIKKRLPKVAFETFRKNIRVHPFTIHSRIFCSPEVEPGLQMRWN